jgi:hypothetical protein
LNARTITLRNTIDTSDQFWTIIGAWAR